MSTSGTKKTTVGQYLVDRLASMGIKHVFGVPGDFVIGFCDVVARSEKLKWIGCCNELNAAYAADGYARVAGAGVVVTTFGVGELSAVNGIAGSWIEHVPVVLIAGAPAHSARRAKLPLHHSLEDYDLPRKVLKKVTAADALLHDPATAPHKIDHCLSVCIRKKRPVYLCIPTDVVSAECEVATAPIVPRAAHLVDQEAMAESAQKAAEMINSAKSPVIIADVGISRAGVKSAFLNLVEVSKIPFVTALMGKGICDETHEQFIGTYMGRRSREECWRAVEAADVVIQLGFVVTDKNTGGFSVKIPRDRIVSASDEDIVRIRRARFDDVPLGGFLAALTPLLRPRVGAEAVPHTRASETSVFSFKNPPCAIAPDAPLGSSHLFSVAAHYIPENCIVVADAGVASFGSAEMLLPKGASYISQVFYVSIGHSVPAAFGASIAAPNRKVALFVGDGSFQMTAQELSSMIRNKCNVTVFLIDNDGYTVERLIHQGTFNDIGHWHYHLLPQALGADKPGVLVKTESELDQALAEANRDTGNRLTFLHVVLPVDDAPQSLVMAAQDMRKSEK